MCCGGLGRKSHDLLGWILTNLTTGVYGFDLLQNETVLLGIHRGKVFFIMYSVEINRIHRTSIVVRTPSSSLVESLQLAAHFRNP